MRIAIGIVAVLFLPLLVAVALLLGTDRHESQAAPLAGAIFTTTPDGGIVNENVRYEDKRDVYLDGGPPPNAPRTAAGLPDGDYVFQVTDPSGKVLLSEDASKCRVFRVDEGVIVALRDKNGSFADHTATDACHVNDNPPHPTNPGVRGDTGKHDTNVGVDHGPPAIVVQLMPFFDTPNPGGVYKAWVMPIDRYTANGGDLEDVPEPQCVNPRNGRPANNCNGNSVQVGFQRDPGFGPPRDQVKTDNFKVREFRPPEITVRKFHDIDADGIWDPGEPEIGVDQCVESAGADEGDIITCPGGWPYDFTEPVDGGTVTNRFFTPNTHVAGIPGTYTACELVLNGWQQSATYLNGVLQPSLAAPNPCVDISVAGASGETHEVIFGDFMPTSVSGRKAIDMNADGDISTDGCPSAAIDPVNNAGCEGITIHLFGTDNIGQAVHQHDTTDSDGAFSFAGLRPGSYTVCEEVPSEFLQSFPGSGAACAGHPAAAGDVVRAIGHGVVLLSGDVVTDRDFGNFSLGEIHGLKFFDRNGNQVRDSGEEGIAGIRIHLFGADGTGAAVHLHTSTDTDGDFSFLDLVPGSYTVCEEVPADSGLTQTFPDSGANCTAHPADIGGIVQAVGHAVTLTSDEVCEDKDFGNFGPCDGLTPGYWGNWRNHYTEAQFLTLLPGTVASSIAEADAFLNSIGCDNDDALHCMRRFLLANQLTLNLTLHPQLPNPDDAGLIRLCSIPGIGTLGDAIDDALAALAAAATPNPNDDFTRDEILEIKNRLAAFAELNG